MNKFNIIIGGVGVEEYDRFLWHMEIDGIHRLFSRLVAFKVADEGIFPVYQPAISVESRSGQLFIELHWSRNKSRVFLFDRMGIHSQVYDVREQ